MHRRQWGSEVYSPPDAGSQAAAVERDGFAPGVEEATILRSGAATRPPAPRRVWSLTADAWRAVLVESRLVVGIVLIAAGIMWAIVRGLRFYGVGLAELGYDLDQPPLLLVYVGAWLLSRSRRR
jgi:hypothetical protein